MIYNLINRSKSHILPRASEVLECYLRQEKCPYWTAFFVKYKDVVNDQFFSSYFLTSVDASQYLILRTGCFPYIKYHCSRIDYPLDARQVALQNGFFNCLKVMNLGIGTLAYGIGGMILTTHEEAVETSKGQVKIYFWYKENRNSPY